MFGFYYFNYHFLGVTYRKIYIWVFACLCMRDIEPRFESRSNTDVMNALARQDAVAYFNICSEQGREPEEDPSLYDLGKRIVRGRDLTNYVHKSKPRQVSVQPKRGYDAFVQGAQGFNIRDYFSQTEGKRSLLVKCFPNRAKEQEWDKMPNGKIGKLFEIMLNDSKKRKD